MIRLHSFFVRIYFIRISRLRFMKIYEYFKNLKPKSEIFFKKIKITQIPNGFRLNCSLDKRKRKIISYLAN